MFKLSSKIKNETMILKVKSIGIEMNKLNTFSNFSKTKLIKNVEKEISAYKGILDGKILQNYTYSKDLKKKLKTQKKVEEFQNHCITVIHSAPFVKKYCYYDDFFIRYLF